MKNPSISIKQIFSQTNKMILCLAILPLISSVILYSRQIIAYQSTINNIKQANAIVEKSDNMVLEKMWDLVFGQLTPKQYSQEDILEELRLDIQTIKQNTQTLQEASTLDIALRTLDTLDNYQEEIITNIQQNTAVSDNQQIMEQVDSVTVLLSDILQEFVQVEINLASDKNNQMATFLTLITFIEILAIVIIIYFVKKNQQFQSRNIQEPLNNLVQMSNELAKGNWIYRLESPDTLEFITVTESLNNMADNLVTLLEENALKQYHLAQSEARVLQAQIMPHFIYNSLDAILQLIEQSQYNDATEMTHALSDFFRISLNKGNDWITVTTEIKHVEDYLKIADSKIKLDK